MFFFVVEQLNPPLVLYTFLKIKSWRLIDSRRPGSHVLCVWTNARTRECRRRYNFRSKVKLVKRGHTFWLLWWGIFSAGHFHCYLRLIRN
jgi:hypothetical protein